MKYKLLILALFVFVKINANYVFNYLTIENGLGHTDATCLSQDDIGLMWIGTNNGLHMYDGYTLKRYDFYQKKEQKIFGLHNRIQCMAKIGNHLWLGSKSGLICFDTVNRTFVDYSTENLNKEILNGDIVSLLSDESDNLWIKTQSAFYTARAIGNTLHFIEWKNNYHRQQYGFYGKAVQMHYNNDVIWIKEGDILVCLRVVDNFIYLEKTYSLKQLSGEIANSFYIKEKSLYLRTSDGCYKFKIENDEVTINKEEKSFIKYSNLGGTLLSSTSGLFVIGSDETIYNSYYGGIFSIKNPFSKSSSIEYFNENNIGKGRDGLIVKDIMVDSFNNLWVATMNWGVRYCSLSTTLFNSFSFEDVPFKNILELSVVSVAEDSKDKVWLCTEGGVLMIYDVKNRKSEIIHRFPKGFKCQILKKSKDGKLLYIGAVKGLYEYDIAENKIIKVFDLYSITGIEELDNDMFYVSTFGNGFLILKKYQSKIKKWGVEDQYLESTPHNISSNFILSFVMNSTKNEVFCATEKGISRIFLEKGQVQKISSYKTSEYNEFSISSDYVAAIDIENDTVVWTGTIGGGVNRIHFLSDKNDDYKAEVFTTDNMLTSNDAEIIYLDNKNNLWVGGNGICCIDRNNKAVSSFGHADGLLKQPFKVGSGCRMQDGTICMGGLLGLNTFNPENIYHRNNMHNSDFLVTRMELNSGENDKNIYTSREVSLYNKDEIMLDYKENNFKIYFTASGFRIADNIVYRYKIKEWNDDWNMLSFENSNIQFVNFPDGSYNLEIGMSEDNGKTWDEKNSKKIKIVVLPPWWRTWYVKISASIIVILLIVLIVYLKIRSIRLSKENMIQQIEKQHTEELYQAKQRFFVNVSHEFKTPLTLISLAAEHLSERTSGNECDSIRKNTEHMTSLISELMDLRKGELGIMDYSFVHDDITAVVNEVINEVSPWLNKKKQSLDMFMFQERVDMDFNRKGVVKIILNLLSNAIKYTDYGRRIEVRTTVKNVYVLKPYFKNSYMVGELSKGEKYWIFTIKDEGIGITQNSINNIYDRFFQVNDTHSKHLGSGIGLAIVKNSVLAHNGVIIVSSERESGTEFIVALPMKQDDAKVVSGTGNFVENTYVADLPEVLSEMNLGIDTSNTSEIGETKDVEKPVVLLVEDNKDLLAAMKSHLSIGYQVITAENGKEGLVKVMDFYPDIIVSDVMMPEMDGMEMCREIRSHLSSAYIPIVLLTAKSEVEHQIEGYEAGADIYMPKPFSVKVLDAAIHRLLHIKSLNLAKGGTIEKHENNASLETPIKDSRENLVKKNRQDFLERLYSIVNDNIQEADLSVDFFANAMNMSRSKLYSYVKEATDITLAEYIRNKRLEKAAHLLQTTTMNITEVMYETGFVNRSHFSKLFKQKFGVSPNSYLKEENSNKFV